MDTGIFCISLDTELLWGRHFLANWKDFDRHAKNTRPAIKKIVELFELNQVPATWAVVGHLFLDHCDSQDGKKHSEIVRPQYNWRDEDWFANDPATNIKTSPGWYGEDIVTLLKKSKYQEIGCHTFSHLILGDPGCSQEAAESDLAMWNRLANLKNIKATSFVFPKNSIGHIEVLKKYGFTTYRGQDSRTTSKIPHLISTILSVIDLFLPIAPSVSIPIREDGLLNIPASWYFVSARGKRKYIPAKVRVRKAKKGIDKAIEEKKIFHLWTHPIDFAFMTDELLNELQEIILYAKEKERDGKLKIKSMKQISELFPNE